MGLGFRVLGLGFRVWGLGFYCKPDFLEFPSKAPKRILQDPLPKAQSLNVQGLGFGFRV